MVFWYRIKQSQLKTLSNQFKRCYFQLHGRPCLLNYTATHTTSLVLDKCTGLNRRIQFDFFNHVRFFAAPVVQVKPKQEEKESSDHRLNEQITSPIIRLVTDEGHDVVSRNEALERAKRLKVDLVEVDRKSKPPVCKLMDYHRERYNKRLRMKERLKGKSDLALKKGVCKEVRFASKIEGNDLQMKADTVRRLMERGYRVKCMATGTEQQDLGGLLSRLAALIEEFAVVESGPHVEKKQAYVIVRHAKFGPMKKKQSKKLSDIVMPTGPKLENSPQTPDTAVETVSENEDDDYSEEDEPIEDPVKNKQSTWLVRDANDDFDKVFNRGNDPSEGSRPVPGSTKIPSPSPVSENRYRREPRSVPPHTNGNGHNARDLLRSGPGFGAFTDTETNNTKHSGAAVVNRYKKVPSVKPPGSNFQGNNRRPDQARWGGVRTDNSNVQR